MKTGNVGVWLQPAPKPKEFFRCGLGWQPGDLTSEYRGSPSAKDPAR